MSLPRTVKFIETGNIRGYQGWVKGEEELSFHEYGNDAKGVETDGGGDCTTK